MRWFLFRQDSAGSRVPVADFDTQQAAHEALASYQYHHPQFAPYFVEGRESAVAQSPPPPVAAAVPPLVSGPMPRSQRTMPAPEGNEKAPGSQRSSNSQAVALVVAAAVVVVGALALALLLFNGSGDGDVAIDAAPVPPAIERTISGEEPTAVPVPGEPVPLKRPTPEPPAEPSTPEPVLATPEPEEVTLTQGGGTFETILARGAVNCGVSGRAVAFSQVQADGSMTGFDADMCRAVAAAILGDAEAVNFVGLTAAERFTALQVGDVDVLMRNSTFTQSRDTDVGVDFGPTTYYDGQQLMGRASDGFSVNSQLVDIEDGIVCALAGTTTELNILEETEAAGIGIQLLTFESFDVVADALIAGECDLVTTDGSSLIAQKEEHQPDGEEWVIFPQIPLSKEPLGPIYRQDDSRFADIVNWTVYVMLTADENGINQANVIDVSLSPPNGEIDRLFGGPGELQSVMGLSPDAFFQVIVQVGSYSDVFARHLEPRGIRLVGSLNDLWSHGGLMYPPPAR